MKVGDLVRWVSYVNAGDDEIAGMIIQVNKAAANTSVEVWFLNGQRSEWHYAYDLEVIWK